MKKLKPILRALFYNKQTSVALALAVGLTTAFNTFASAAPAPLTVRAVFPSRAAQPAMLDRGLGGVTVAVECTDIKRGTRTLQGEFTTKNEPTAHDHGAVTFPVPVRSVAGSRCLLTPRQTTAYGTFQLVSADPLRVDVTSAQAARVDFVWRSGR